MAPTGDVNNLFSVGTSFRGQCLGFDILTALKDGDSGTHIPVFLFHSRMRNCYISSYISSADYPRLPSGYFYYFPFTWFS